MAEKLKQILETDENRKPILELKPIEKTAVNTPTQEEYWDMMRVYECGDWKWASGTLPTEKNDLKKDLTKICVDAGIDSVTGNLKRFGYAFKIDYLRICYNIISPREFYYEQGITPKMLKEINDWFDKSNRDLKINERNLL